MKNNIKEKKGGGNRRLIEFIEQYISKLKFQLSYEATIIGQQTGLMNLLYT